MKGAPRKLRKSCSLASCSKTPGECMHCTCDGRCGQHEGGHCGVRREGNGKSCKRDGCLRDDSCLHSTRATCCHCRNLVSSSNRSSRKRTRADSTSVMAVTAPLAHTQKELLVMGEQDEDDGATSPTSCDALLPLSADLFFEMCEEISTKRMKTEISSVDERPPQEEKIISQERPQAQPQSQQETTATTEEQTEEQEHKSLCEYDQWAARRNSCNLVVIVEGTQFNLHKHPMLLESQLLNAKARESVVTTQSPVPVIQLPLFPGGAATFEMLCVYAYTGELTVSATNVAVLYTASHFLNMGLAVKSKTREYLNSITQSGATLPQLLRVTHTAVELSARHDALLVCQELQLECVDTVARVLPLQVEAVGSILSLPCELFLQITMEILATRGSEELSMDPVRQLCVQAELAQSHRDVEEKADPSVVSARCLELLTQSLAPTSTSSSRSVAADGGSSLVLPPSTAVGGDDDDDALFMKMMYDFELEPTADADDADSMAFAADVLSVGSLEPFAFASRRVSCHRMASEAFAV